MEMVEEVGRWRELEVLKDEVGGGWREVGVDVEEQGGLTWSYAWSRPFSSLSFLIFT